jgi:hypothetical protein
MVKSYHSALRRGSVLGVPNLAGVFETPPPATVEELFAALSTGTLEAILGELPEDSRLAAWRGKVRQALSLSGEGYLPREPAHMSAAGG